MALARFGISYRAFLDITPREFYLALEDDGKQKKDKMDAVVRPICETIRLQTFHLVNVQLAKKDQVTDEKRLIPFPWDRERFKQQSKQGMVTTMKSIAAYYKLKEERKKKRK